MLKSEIKKIIDMLSILQGQKLQYFSRAAAMGDIGFEVLSETQQKIKYALHVACHFRVICGDKLIIAKGDIFQPNDKLLENLKFDWENFDWDVKGINRYDDLANKYFANGSFMVENITCNKLGDLRICLSNHFVLEVCADVTGNEECWRFFEVGNTKRAHLVVSSQGVEED